MNGNERAYKYILKFAIILAFTTTLAGCLVPARASATTVVTAEPTSSSGGIGQTLTVNFTVLNVQNLYALEVTVGWNASVLRITSIDARLGLSEGVLNDPLFIVQNQTDQDQGKYVLAATSCAPAQPFSGSGNIARITFNLTGLGISELSLTSKLYDCPPPDRFPPVSLPIDHTVVNGEIVIISEFTSVAAFLFFVCTLTVLIAICKRHFKRCSSPP